MTDENQEMSIEKRDERTGEIIPAGTPTQLVPGILAQIDLNKVGTLELSEQASAVLDEPLDPEDVQIRPDGLVYLPWTWYNNRLNRAFGRLGWGVIPQGSPKVQNSGNSVLVVWLTWLVIKGTPVSMAGGEMTYQPSNYTMSYGDALEGARSNSLARNCKNLGMALELWDAQWVANWKARHAHTTKNERGKTIWVKNTKRQAPTGSVVESVIEDTGGVIVDVTPEPQEVKATSTDNPTVYKVSDLRTIPNVRMIGKLTGKKDSEVVAMINGLDKNKTYTISSDGQIVEHTGD